MAVVIVVVVVVVVVAVDVDVDVVVVVVFAVVCLFVCEGVLPDMVAMGDSDQRYDQH